MKSRDIMALEESLGYKFQRRDLIEQALKLPPGPKAWAVIFEHYPELILTPEALAQKFRESAARASREADALLDRYIPRTNFPN